MKNYYDYSRLAAIGNSKNSANYLAKVETDLFLIR